MTGGISICPKKSITMIIMMRTIMVSYIFMIILEIPIIESSIWTYYDRYIYNSHRKYDIL